MNNVHGWPYRPAEEDPPRRDGGVLDIHCEHGAIVIDTHHGAVRLVPGTANAIAGLLLRLSNELLKQ